MPTRMVTEKLTRLTLVRKGRATAKHPDMRNGVVEVVKADDVSDWYGEFDSWLASQDELGDDPLSDFAQADKESAKPKKNYPDSEGPFAGPHNSFPIRSASDVLHAAQRLHNAKGNKAKIKARIAAIARSKGYALPKTWATTEKSVNTEKVRTLISQLLGVIEETEKAEETPPAETPPEETEKAKAPPHSHNHSHITTYGYSYSHEHPHGDAAHAEADDHGTSETMHAHEHIAKSTDIDLDAVKADLAGLKADLDTAKESATTLQTEVETLKAQLAEATEAKRLAEEKVVAAEKAKSDAEAEAVASKQKAERKPLVAARPQETEKSAPTVTHDMKFDDAFDALMGRTK